MTIEEMHYDFKMKLNKLDSKQRRNFLIPEIDWLLNEAQELFVKSVAAPRGKDAVMGFERTQRSMDDVRVLVKEGTITTGQNTVHGTYAYSAATLPKNYWHFVRGIVLAKRRGCDKTLTCTLRIRQHDDLSHMSPFDRSDVMWREVNGLFRGSELLLEKPFGEEDLVEYQSVALTYMRKPAYIHFAMGHGANKYYMLPSGDWLEGKQDCELPEHTHREIVDIAVMLAGSQIQGAQEMQLRIGKLQMNHLTES